MKKYIFIISILAMSYGARAYDFSAVAPSGQTLYYAVDYSTFVRVVAQNSSAPYYTTAPTGALEIPSTVTNNGTTYTVNSISDNAFYGCSGLTSITLPSTISAIYHNPFYGCTGLSYTHFTGTVTDWCNIWFYDETSNPVSMSHNLSIGDSVQEYLNLVVPDNVLTLRHHVFCDCDNLHSIVIGNGVEVIAGSAFEGCDNLHSVTIGSSVELIYPDAFGGCVNLTNITSLASPAPIQYYHDSAFYGMPSNIDVHIPCGSSPSYYARWPYFDAFIEDTGYAYSCTAADSTEGRVIVLSSPTCNNQTALIYAEANNGFLFDRWSDNVTNNPRLLTLISDTSITAWFIAANVDTIHVHDTIYIHDTIYEPNGIDRIDAVMAKVYAADGRIVVASPDGSPLPEVLLYDAAGRRLEAQAAGRMPAYQFPVPATGVYLVKVGKHPARKVMVIR